jgi:hypothetical protein
MGNFRTIDIVGRAMGQYQESTKNLMAIGNARRKLAQEQEDREFKKREAELNLEKAKREGQMSELEYQIGLSAHNEHQKQQKKIGEGSQALIDQEEHKNKKAADEAMTVTGKMFQQDPDGTVSAMAMVRGQQQKRQIVPTFNGGHFGYKSVEIEEEKAGYTRKDVVARADKQFENKSDDDDRTYDDFLSESEDLLSGKSRGKSASPVAEDNGMGVGYSSKGAISSKKNTGKKIRVKDPNGRTGFLPQASIEKARKNGYTILE